MPFRTLESRQITYHFENRGMGTPCLMLHGFTGRGRQWYPLLMQLQSELTLRFIAPDILGHGQTELLIDVSRYSMEEISRDLFALVDAPSHLLGYSMGGRLALYIATHYPDRVKSLILESASPGLKTEAEREVRRRQDNELADKIEANGIERFVDYWESLPLWDSQQQLPLEKRHKLHKQRSLNQPLGLANSLRGMGTGVMPSLWDKLPALSMPVKLIVGEHDSKFVALNQEMAALIPAADLTIVEGAGHTVHLEKPEVYLQTVQQFLMPHMPNA